MFGGVRGFAGVVLAEALAEVVGEAGVDLFGVGFATDEVDAVHVGGAV